MVSHLCYSKSGPSPGSRISRPSQIYNISSCTLTRLLVIPHIADWDVVIELTDGPVTARSPEVAKPCMGDKISPGA